jgi:REP element-mobilizing transposase RayT
MALDHSNRVEEQPLPRHPRIFVDGGIYHVHARAGRAQPDLTDEVLAGLFLDLLRETKGRDGFTLLAWVLMARHYHLVLRTADVPLWRTMASLQVGFTKRFNRMSGFAGPFWQGRYKAVVVPADLFLADLIAYVHLHPVVEGVVEDPAAYGPSGHREVLGLDEPAVADVDAALAVFGEDRRTARSGYLDALESRSTEAWISARPGRLPWWRRASSEDVSPAPAAGTERPVLTADGLAEAACRVMGQDRDAVAGPTRVRPVVRAREAMTLVAVERYGIRVTDLARALGRNQDTVSRWLGRAAARRRRDAGFAEVVEDLDRRLSERPAAPASPARRHGPSSGFVWET